MNVFKHHSMEPVTIKDTPDRRVMLECQKCGTIIGEARYHPSAKTLLWNCDCGFISMQEDFEIE